MIQSAERDKTARKYERCRQALPSVCQDVLVSRLEELRQTSCGRRMGSIHVHRSSAIALVQPLRRRQTDDVTYLQW